MENTPRSGMGVTDGSGDQSYWAGEGDSMATMPLKKEPQAAGTASSKIQRWSPCVQSQGME